MSQRQLDHLKVLYNLGQQDIDFKPYTAKNFRDTIKRLERQLNKCSKQTQTTNNESLKN